MASPLQEGLYQPFSARERYYDIMADSLIKANVQSDGTINDEELHKAITLLKSEKETEYKRNIPVQEGLYQPSPARERYYDKTADSLIEANAQSDETINNEELHKAITLLKSEKEAEHECNIQNMTQVDDYKLPWKDKYATTVNDTVNDTAYTF